MTADDRPEAEFTLFLRMRTKEIAKSLVLVTLYAQAIPLMYTDRRVIRLL